MNEHIIGDFEKMKQRILETALEGDSRWNAMDIGSVELEKEVSTFQINTPGSSPAKPAVPPAPLQVQPNGNHANNAEPSLSATEGAPAANASQIRCHTCNQVRHKSFQCPLRNGAGKGTWKEMREKGCPNGN